MRHAPLCDSPGADVPEACHNSVSTSAVAGDPGRLGTMVREDGGGEVPVPAVGRLTTSDLQFIVTTLLPDVDPSVAVTVLRRDPDRVEELLDDERLFKRLRSEDALVRVSPWLLFTVLLRRVRRELRALPYTVEQRGGERVAVFDAERAGALLGDREIQDYLIELLVSFTRTDSLSLEVEEAGRLRRRRFSDLSSEDMIALAALMPEDLRFPILRRVADIALFVTGSFPEHAEPFHLQPAVGLAGGAGSRAEQGGSGRGGIGKALHGNGRWWTYVEVAHETRRGRSRGGGRVLDAGGLCRRPGRGSQGCRQRRRRSPRRACRCLQWAGHGSHVRAL